MVSVMHESISEFLPQNMDPFRGLVGFRPRNGGMAEWRNGGMAEWRNGGMANWWNGGMAEWRNGIMANGMAEWRNGRQND